VTILEEPRRGKNAALNTGLQALEGDLVVLTDDDTVPRSDWLARLRETADAQPDYTVFGGPILARWPSEPPTWLLQWVPLGPVLGVTNPAWQDGPVSPEHVFGANMAIRSRVFAEGQRFNTSIGPSGGSYAMGSETEFTIRLVQSGSKCWHCKQAVVEHIIRPHQMSKDWILSRAVRYGRSRGRLAISRLESPPKMLFGFPRYLLREMVLQWFRTWKHRLSGTEEQSFKAQWRLKFLIGQVLDAHTAWERGQKKKD
jgi:GT2 family glycosyltransferase